eukprot:TRINITY_DN779815_c0_g1_i1.p1 TRINITY_DN779815_c0_g1~~TRINITY_DN779815_c0_g1_i1.p1  ORF type:complete len:386 (-),score=99.74 TRINITY_DN779815_c0_g1_i1:166-1323(-)
MEVLSKFDLFPKTMDTWKKKTLAGAFNSLFALVLIVIFVLWNMGHHMGTTIEETSAVDPHAGDDHVDITFNITFPDTRCAMLSVGAMDATGAHVNNLRHRITKQNIDREGIADKTMKHELGQSVHAKPNKDSSSSDSAEGDKQSKKDECLSCFGAENPQRGITCCNTCKDIQHAYNIKGWEVPYEKIPQCAEKFMTEHQSHHKGCIIAGSIAVHKVAGNFHVAPHHAINTLSRANQILNQQWNVTHTINNFRIGDAIPDKKYQKYPLNDYTFESDKPGMQQYFLNVVPAQYIDTRGTVAEAARFSVTKHFRVLRKDDFVSTFPGVFFVYDFSPIITTIKQTSTPWSHLLTNMCAIIGGIITLIGVFDKITHFILDRFGIGQDSLA